MTKILQVLLICLLTTSYAFAQISFSDESFSLLANPTVYSGVSFGISDMNGDDLDDIIRYNAAQTLNIEYQQADGTTFNNFNYGAIGGNLWSMCVADIDGNGYNDIMAGGYNDNIKILKANATGNNYTKTEITNPVIFLQGSNFVDIDNNGTVDIFACHDLGLSPAFSNDGNGNFTHDPSLINTSSTVPSDNSGNYGSTWTDYDNDGDLDMYLSKCRGSVTDPFDGRRINMLFQNDGNGNYTDVAGAAGLLPYAQSWASDFADIDNDGDLDCFIANHDILSQILINNGDGTFTDITASTGISSNLAAFPNGIQCIFDDFDNDGFIDLLYTTRNNGHELFRNNGNLTFSSVSNPFPTGGLGIQSAVTGDLDNDGYLDVYAGFAAGYNNPVSNQPDKVFINQSSGNNFVKIRLEGAPGNRNAIGARLEIHGDWGVQVREIRSGESYGIMNSMISHFGLGVSDKIDRLVVRWPDGTTKVLCGLESNQFHVIKMEDMYDNCIYVDASATGTDNGSSWENAFSDLQDALAIGANNAILVAEGTYYPTSGTSRGIFFDIPSGATILGGYESVGSSRDPEIHSSILSGDINMDGTASGNSFHVVRFNSSTDAVLDGISIEDGNADNANSFGRSRGGGIYSSGSSFTLRNCLVRNNNAVFGGGMFATLSPEVNVEGSTFSENTADRGAGLYHSNTTNLYVRHSRIINNSSAIRCVIESNNSLYTYIENSLIANNASSAANAIGIIATNRDQSCDIYNSTILGENLNRSLFSLQIGFGDQLDINIYNSIIGHQNVAFNKSFAIFNNNILNLHTENCYIQGSSVVGTSMNNLYSDTAGDLLLNPDYSVNACSPVVDQGNDAHASAYPKDIDGNDRIFGLNVDIGAYEVQASCLPLSKEIVIPISEHTLFPNPVSDILTVQLDEITVNNLNIQVFDLKGQMMEMTTIPAGGFSTDINVSQWSEGIYILHFIGTEMESKKFVVNK